MVNSNEQQTGRSSSALVGPGDAAEEEPALGLRRALSLS
jgi:hypothetical protein